jgi:hypothetical protein
MESESTKSAISSVIDDHHCIKFGYPYVCEMDRPIVKRHLVLGPNIKTEFRGKCLSVKGMEYDPLASFCDSGNKPGGSVTTGHILNT